MARRQHFEPPAGGRAQQHPRYNPYDADPVDPLHNPPGQDKTPLERDDASNINQRGTRANAKRPPLPRE